MEGNFLNLIKLTKNLKGTLFLYLKTKCFPSKVRNKKVYLISQILINIIL